MENELLELFNIEHVKFIVKFNENCQQIIGQFGRFLAGYYLNFTLKFYQQKNVKLEDIPNLFQWIEFETDNNNNEKSIKILRQKIANILPSEYSPTFVVLLLWNCELYLEALLFVDHFNDLRSQLILRFIIDQIYNLKLFEEHINKCIVEDLIENIANSAFILCDDRNLRDGNIKIRQSIDALIQIQVVFELNLLEPLKQRCLYLMEEQFLELTDQVDQRVSLPRPPIYSMPCCSSSFTTNLEDILEILISNRIYFYLEILIQSLRSTNRLNSLITNTTLLISTKMASSSTSFQTNVPYFLNSEYVGGEDKLEDGDLDIFQSIILCILRINLRDRLSIEFRRGQMEAAKDEKINELMFKLAQLFPLINEENLEPVEETAGDILERWINNIADEDDVQYIMTFFLHLQKNNFCTERYLPPLNDSTHEKWFSVLLSGVKRNSKKMGLNIFGDTQKFNNKSMLEDRDFLRVQFLSQEFGSFSLSDPLLIQIFLNVNPWDLVEAKKTSLINEKIINSNSEENLSDMESEIFRPTFSPLSNNPEKLLKQIRASIQRLSQMKDSSSKLDSLIKVGDNLSGLPTPSKLNKLLNFNQKLSPPASKSIQKRRILRKRREQIERTDSSSNSSEICTSIDSSIKSSDNNNNNTNSSLSLSNQAKNFKTNINSPPRKKELKDPPIHNPETIRIEIEQIGQRLMRLKNQLNQSPEAYFSSGSSEIIPSERYLEKRRVKAKEKEKAKFSEKSPNTLMSSKSSVGYYSTEELFSDEFRKKNSGGKQKVYKKSGKRLFQEEIKQFKRSGRNLLEYDKSPLSPNFQRILNKIQNNFEEDQIFQNSPESPKKHISNEILSSSEDNIEEIIEKTTSPPISIGKLDLAQLDSSPERRRRKQTQKNLNGTENWWEIEIYPRQQSSNKNSPLKSSSKNSNSKSQKNSANSKISYKYSSLKSEFSDFKIDKSEKSSDKEAKKFPDWMKLLPMNEFNGNKNFKYNDGPATETRLLWLPSKDEPIKANNNKSARSETSKIQKNEIDKINNEIVNKIHSNLYDSGFIEPIGKVVEKNSKTENTPRENFPKNDGILFSSDISREEVEKLLEIYSKN